MALSPILKYYWFGNLEPDTRLEWDESGNLIYQGYAEPGTSESTKGWYILKYRYDGSGNVISTESAPSAVWDAREFYFL